MRRETTDEGTAAPPTVALEAPGRVPVPATSSPADWARAKPGQPANFGGAMPFVPVACRKNAFCEDFEEAAPLTRWTSGVTTLGMVDFAGPSSSLGAKALRASTTTSGGAAYLTLAGPAFGQTWVGFLGFALRVDALPSGVLGGPEIAVTDANGAITRVGFSVHPDGIALHQYFESCAGPSCAARSDLVTDVRPAYGRIEVTVDGVELIVLPLSVTPFDGNAEVHAGITVADSAPATARIDDVVFFTH